jgi:multidrug efflux pump subunit AcrA (membrane-fusion protein)
MRASLWLFLLIVVFGSAAGCQRTIAQSPSSAAPAPAAADEVTGKTQPAPGRLAAIAPAVLHPVEEVLVRVGDRVKKGQPLILIDADEPKADVRAKEGALQELLASLERLRAEPRQADQDEARASLRSAAVSAEEARQLMERIEPSWQRGAIPDQRYYAAKAALAKAQADEKAAAARLDKLLRRPYRHELAEMAGKIAAARGALDAAKAELEHYTVAAFIEGTVSRLDVVPGTVSRPGTTLWGEIIDLRELDVRCEVASAAADRLKVGQVAEVSRGGDAEGRRSGRVAFVGPAADPHSGRVPVLVRLRNPQEHLRSGVEVKVRFSVGRVAEQGK